jgi:hypothetical protein
MISVESVESVEFSKFIVPNTAKISCLREPTGITYWTRQAFATIAASEHTKTIFTVIYSILYPLSLRIAEWRLAKRVSMY